MLQSLPSLSLLLLLAVAFSTPAWAEGLDPGTANQGGAVQPLPEPEAWLPSKGRECRNRGKYRRFCAGPRKVAAPTGKAGVRGRDLGLGSRKTANQLLLGEPDRAWVEAARDVKAGPGLRWPVPGGKYWRGFGRVRRGPKRNRGHKGVDLGAAEGSPIVASQAGLVAYANNELRGYGNVLMVVHGDGTVALYAHCKSILVFPGQLIEQGQVVAQVGHTGIARGTHLHFEYRKRGRPRDPLREFVDPDPSVDQRRDRIARHRLQKARKRRGGASRRRPAQGRQRR